MEIIVAVVTVVILIIITLRKPYIGLIVVVVSEFVRVGTLLPGFGAIRFQALMMGFLILIFMKDLILTRNIKIPSYPQNKAQIGFLMVMGVNVLFAFITTTAYETFMAHIAVIAIYFIILGVLDTQRKFAIFIISFILANAFIALYGLNVYFIKGQELDNLAMGGFVAGADDFAVVMNAVIPFVYFLYQSEKLNKKKLFYAILTIIFVTAVICAFSRGGWVSLIGMLFLILLFSKYKTRTMIVIFLAFLVVLNIVPNEFYDEFNTISSETSTASGRFELWWAAFQMFLDHPILGVGMSNFPSMYGRFYIPDNPHSYHWLTVHSVYFQLISEMGLVGLLSFLFIVYWAIKDNLLIMRKLKEHNQTNSFSYAISQALIVSILGYLLGGVFLSLLYYPTFYFVSAITVALRHTVDANYRKLESI